MPTDVEKREHERKQFFGELLLEFTSGRRKARISDISLGGCYVDSIASVIEGETIRLIITIPSGESIQFAGEVAYVLPGLGFGVRFIGLNEERTSFLDKIID